MPKQLMQAIPLAILLLVATITVVLHTQDAQQTPCLRSPKVCQPEIPVPCQPNVCPFEDTR
ncbi:MAG: hypothetical protein OXL96_21225 [Candidatus Poribacteria bacterium]|nr:hypothetical protein [Candidatus Poribacteria bacterium]